MSGTNILTYTGLTGEKKKGGYVHDRLQNSRFFLKISKEIGKAWRKSLKREARKPHTPVKASVRRVRRESLPSLALCFQPRSRPFV